MKMNDMIIASVDDHIIEPPSMFDQHLSAEHRKLAPQYVLDDRGDARCHADAASEDARLVIALAATRRLGDEAQGQADAVDQSPRLGQEVQALQGRPIGAGQKFGQKGDMM